MVREFGFMVVVIVIMLFKNCDGTLALVFNPVSKLKYGQAGFGLLFNGAGNISLDGLFLSKGFIVVVMAII